MSEPGTTERVPIDSVRPDAANVRLHPSRNLDQIKASLERFKQQKPIVVDAAGTIRAGNGTWEAAKALGWTHIEVRRSDLAGAEAAAYAIADNRSAESALWDPTALDATLKALADAGAGLDDSWFSSEELSALLASVSLPDGDDWADALGALPDGDRPGFRQMTFTLSDAQAIAVERALTAAKRAGSFGDTGNDNSNGNALARVCAAYPGAGDG